MYLWGARVPVCRRLLKCGFGSGERGAGRHSMRRDMDEAEAHSRISVCVDETWP
jgi:hypothetical protein